MDLQTTWYDFIVDYKAKKENKEVDALSRKEELNGADQEEAKVFAVTSPVAQWTEELEANYADDEEIHKILLKIKNKPWIP
jgi:hypothetical protein